MIVSPLAVHESGHCVISLALGLGAVDRVTLDPPVTHFTAPDAWAHGGRPDNLPCALRNITKGAPSLPDRARWRLAAVRLLAGVCAEAKFAGEPFKVVLKRNGSDRRSVQAFMDGLASGSDARDALWCDLFDETHRLVERHWDAILRLARCLEISRELNGFEVQRIVSRAQVAA